MGPSKIVDIALLASLLGLTAANVPTDLVKSIPGFNATSFNVYSGYLQVPGPFKLNSYDSLTIHYQFSHAQSSPATKPVVVWHQGGPGGSSVQGGYIEMGFFLVGDQIKINPHAWNAAANMLYLESPAGSGGDTGFSTCNKAGKPVACRWDDRTQAEAYAHTLSAFFKAFPEFLSNQLFLAGESYFGQYGPNIAHYILEHGQDFQYNLTGMMVGNGCWGGSNNSFNCNGPNAHRNDLEAFWGKGLISNKQYNTAFKACGFGGSSSAASHSQACKAALDAAHDAVGPFNLYDIYDNCPATSEYLKRSNKNMRWLLQTVRGTMDATPFATPTERARLLNDAVVAAGGAEGGYSWNCGGTYPPGEIAKYFARKDVQNALHLRDPGLSSFDYATTGPASVLLYPELAKHMRILIYNGDADMCVPYKGNEEWIEMLESQGVFKESAAWRPWFSPDGEGGKSTAAGGVTVYDVVGSNKKFTFLTIRLAGHMVPLFRPTAALRFFENFIADQPQ